MPSFSAACRGVSIAGEAMEGPYSPTPVLYTFEKGLRAISLMRNGLNLPVIAVTRQR
jgi:hypothetical protein